MPFDCYRDREGERWERERERKDGLRRVSKRVRERASQSGDGSMYISAVHMGVR